MSAPSADMICGRPNQLPSISDVDSKLSLTRDRPSLQSPPEPLAFDMPPRSCTPNMRQFVDVSDARLPGPSQFKTGTPLTCALPRGMFVTVLIFLRFSFQVTSQYGTGGQMDRQDA